MHPHLDLPSPGRVLPLRCIDPPAPRHDLHEHPVTSGKLVKLIVSVTVGVSIAAAAFASCRTEIQRSKSAKAFQLVTQIESLKTELRKEIDFGERSPPTSEADLAAQLLRQILVKGIPLSGVPQTDAVTLGFLSLTVGSLDIEDPDGNVATPGTPASVTLRNGLTLGGQTHQVLTHDKE